MQDKPSDKNQTKAEAKVKARIKDKTIWCIVIGVLAVALILMACMAVGSDHAAGRLLAPSASPTLTPSPSPTPGATALPEGYRLPLVPIFETPQQTTPPTPASIITTPIATPIITAPSGTAAMATEEPIQGAYSEEERTFLAAGFLQGEPVALFVIRQQTGKLTALSLSPRLDSDTMGDTQACIAALKAQIVDEIGVELTEYIYMDFAALPALAKATGEEDFYITKGQEALALEGEERARAMLLLGAELFDALKDITPLNALLLQGTIQGQWGSSLKLSRLWALGSAMKKCTERVLVLVPPASTDSASNQNSDQNSNKGSNLDSSEEQKNILKKFFITR